MASSLDAPLPNVMGSVETLTFMSRHRVTLEQVHLKVPDGHPQVGPDEGFEKALSTEPLADVPLEEVRADVTEEPDPRQEPPAPIPALRQACRNLGVGTSGSKQVLYKRLKNKVARRELEDQLGRVLRL